MAAAIVTRSRWRMWRSSCFSSVLHLLPTQCNSHTCMHKYTCMCTPACASDFTHPCNHFPFTHLLGAISHFSFGSSVHARPPLSESWGQGVPWGRNTSCLVCRSHCWIPLPTWGARAVAHCALCLQLISSRWKSSGFGWVVSCLKTTGFLPPRTCVLFFTNHTKPTLFIGRTQGSIHRLDSWEPSISEQCSTFPIRSCGLHEAQQLTDEKRNDLCFLGSGAHFMVWSGCETHSPEFWRAVTILLSLQVRQVFPARNPLILQRSSDTGAP